MNIAQVYRKFPTQESCIEYLEQKRWAGVPVCPYCGSTNTNHLEKQSRHYCNGCRKSFSVTINTIFHDTKVPLQDWFALISLMLNARKGISACQASRDLGIRRPTVWSMMNRIRKAMQEDKGLLSGIVEMDETYIGGKPRMLDSDIRERIEKEESIIQEQDKIIEGALSKKELAKIALQQWQNYKPNLSSKINTREEKPFTA